jgi:hypothetical protein
VQVNLTQLARSTAGRGERGEGRVALDRAFHGVSVQRMKDEG